MGLELYTEKLPVELQEAFKADIAKAVIVSNREDAKKFMTENQFVNAEFQGQLSTRYEESQRKFTAEKLPGMIEEEIKKRGTKQPWEIRIEELEAREKESLRQITLKDRRAEAQGELAKLGMDLKLADFLLDEDEAKFKEKIGIFTGASTAWKDAEIKKIKEGVFSQGQQKAGTTSPTDLEAQYKKAMETGNVAQAMQIKETIGRSMT